MCPVGRYTEPKKYIRQYIQDIISHYGNSCEICESIEDLVIDHKYGGGRRHCAEHGLGKGGGYNFYLWLKRNNYPSGYTVDGIYYSDGFRVLCANCNNAQPKLGVHILQLRLSKAQLCPHLELVKQRAIKLSSGEI